MKILSICFFVFQGQEIKDSGRTSQTIEHRQIQPFTTIFLSYQLINKNNPAH